MKPRKSRRTRRKENEKTLLKRFLRFLSVSILLIAFILLVVHILVDLLEDEIFDYFVKRIEKKSGGRYSIKYDFVNLDFIGGGIHTKNLVVTPGQEGQFKIRIPVLKIEGIFLPDLVIGKSLHINKLYVKKGEVVIIKTKNPGNEAKKKSKPLTSIFIKNLDVEKASFKLIGPGKETPILTIPEVSLLFSKLRISAEAIRFKSGQFTLKRPAFDFPDGFYSLKAGAVRFSKSKASLSFDSFELIPKYKRYQFSKKKGYRTDRLWLKADKIIFEKINFSDFFNEQRFCSGLLTVKNPQLDIFRDKRMPRIRAPKKKKFPQQLLRELKFKLKIDNMKISDGNIGYTERTPMSRKPGKLFFAGIQADLKNITNYPELLKKKTSAVLTAAAKVMGKGDLRVTITIPINDKRNGFAFAGHLGKMDMRVFNPMLENSTNLRVNRGTVRSLDFSAGADNDLARGEVTFLYRNLKVSMLKRKSEYERKKRTLVSFLANIIIHEDNPKTGKPARVGKIFFKREEPVPFFGYMWKSLLTGIQSSIGLKKTKRR